MKKIILEGIAEFKAEDRGAAQIAEIDGGDDSPFFVRLHSWDETKEHTEINKMQGKKVRVTVEILDLLIPSCNIPAECHSDDRAVEVKFNAGSWVEQATDNQLLDLLKCGCGGDYAADDVAIFMADHDDEVATMFTYMGLAKGNIGFECHVEVRPLIHWIKEKNKPLYEKVINDKDLLSACCFKEPT